MSSSESQHSKYELKNDQKHKVEQFKKFKNAQINSH